MTALRDAIDYTTLGWVKPELDETLRQTQMEIEGFAEDPSEPSRMRFAAGLLHQVQGTLRMVELYAPAMVAEEMEALAKAIATGDVSDRDEACATLMRGVVLLPDYLERLQGGHKDIPIVLLPLLNELRGVRGEKGLNESVLFAPDLDRPLPASVPEATAGSGRDDNTIAPMLASLRNTLSTWSDAQPADYAQLMQALEGLLGQTQDAEARRMLWVAAETASALRDGALANSASLRDAFGSVEREARRLFENGAVAVAMSPSQLEPTRQLLFHVSGGDQTHPSLEKLRVTFDLSASSPTESELEHARGSVSGRNRALLDTVSAAIKEDLLRIKDALDLYLRTNRSDANELQPQVDALDRVADTLGMLGLGVARNVVLQQRDALREIVFGGRSPDEESLLDVAGALLYVDASLDDQVARLGQPNANADDDMVASESRKILEVLVREAIANFADARQGFVAFVETNWDHAQLTEVPRLLNEVGGALRMLDLPLPAQYLTGVRRYTESELIGRKRVPNGQQLDTLADSLASLEYYLEALRDQRPNSEEILAITRQSLESLRYWPLPAETVAMPAPDAATPAPSADAEDRDLQPVPAAAAPQVPAPAPAPAPETAQTLIHQAASAAGTAGSFDRSNDEIDDEIREVFLEEFEEEIANLDGLLPKWREQPEDMERLRPIRRVFHTLKGSGRLVGAKTLGEFSWKVESMLNRVLDGSRPPSPAVFDLVDQAFLTLPQLHAALRGDASLDVDLPGLEAIADRVAAGEDVHYQPRAPEPFEAVVDTASLEAVETETQSLETAPHPSFPEAAALPADTVAVSVDGVLLEILTAEVDGHLATVDDWLARASVAPVQVDDAMLRAIHTMNGAFAMSEVPAITDATTPAEAYVKRLLGAKRVPEQEGIAALVELATQIRATIAGLLLPVSAVPKQAVLAARLIALRDSLPEATIAIFGAGLADEETAADEVLAAAIEAERLEADRIDGERLEAERIDGERLEAERIEAERIEVERLDAERIAAQRVE
ncbi:MAG: Hpt domain-containing protein, partial [Luteimonas sp.]